MKITLEPTGVIEPVNGVPARIWKGTADNGAKVQAWVHVVRVDLRTTTPAAAAEFEQALRTIKADRNLVSFDMRMVLD